MSQLGKRIARKIDKAILQFGLLEPHDKVVIGLSGGKDSLALTKILGDKGASERYPIPFDVEAVHVRTDFAEYPAGDDFLEIVKSWGIKVTVLEVPVKQRLREGHSLNCWWCSSQRRLEMARYAAEVGANKIALGHHLDDILETFLMNASGKGELSTMLPRMAYDKYPQTIIRPLAWTHEEEIRDYVRQLGLESFTCTCEWDTRSPRKTARRALEELCAGRPRAKDLMFRALANPVNRYLPEVVSEPSSRISDSQKMR
ncbi:MAG: tRNA 2-thiocytidine biosynthesis TtcA family protein [Spirochaetales bacterium]|nr:tRNA 2-thiocytidine biosynthesis TtcA family protein [Spirochaetales bacterium]